jgi:hypothetical protein
MKIKEGDLVYCTQDHYDGAAPVNTQQFKKGKLYKVTKIKDDWCEIEKGKGYWNRFQFGFDSNSHQYRCIDMFFVTLSESRMLKLRKLKRLQIF